MLSRNIVFYSRFLCFLQYFWILEVSKPFCDFSILGTISTINTMILVFWILVVL